MRTIENILADYENGTLTRRERVAALSRLIATESVETILSSLPQDIVQELLDWARKTPAEGGVIIGGELSNEAARTIAQEQQGAILALRGWEKRRERRNGVPAGPTPAGADRDANGSSQRDQPAGEVET